MDVILDRFEVTGNGHPYFIEGSRHRELPALFNDLGYRTGAEIGVARGEFSEELCQAISGLQLLCVDAWSHYEGYRDTVSQARFDGMYAETIERLRPYPANVVKAFSTEAAALVKDGSLDFVFIDAAHDFYHVTQDIAFWSPKVRRGGIVAGHDWKRDKGRDWECHVKDVVLAWTYSHNIKPWFVLRKDKSPTWFWMVK